MARTNLPLTSLASEGVVLNYSTTAIDATNQMNVALPSTGIPASAVEDRLIFIVTNTTASTQTVTIKAGDNTTYANVPAFRAGKGDLVTGNLNATSGTAIIGPLESSRHVQSGGAGADQPAGSVNVNFSAGMTGTIVALLIPRSF